MLHFFQRLFVYVRPPTEWSEVENCSKLALAYNHYVSYVCIMPTSRTHTGNFVETKLPARKQKVYNATHNKASGQDPGRLLTVHKNDIIIIGRPNFFFEIAW